MKYTMKDVHKRTGLTYDTIKFYCNEGLIPNVQRDSNNRRVFSEHDLAWINSLICLRKCDMGIAEIRNYIKLCQHGKETIPERKELLQAKRTDLEQKIARIQANIDYIDMKLKLYDEMMNGEREYYSNLTQD